MSLPKYIAKGLNKLGLFKKLNFIFNISLAGQSVLIPAIHGFGFNYLFKDKEPWFNDVLLLLGDGKDTVVDVGVNTGQSLLKFLYQGKYNSYIGFEPNPGCCYYLNELISVNNIAGASVCNIALSDRTDVLTLNLNEDNWDSSASIIPGFRKNKNKGKSINVATFRGDEVIPKVINSQKVSLIKIDVEGAELEVLKGLQNTITKYQPFIICEILPAYDSDNTERINRQNKLVGLLNQLDYKIYRILKDKKKRFTEFVRIDSIEIHNRIEWCDYLFCHSTCNPIT